jgi:hypothetical protein
MPARFNHPRAHRTRHEERTLQVHRHHAVPFRRVELLEAGASESAVNRRIVDKHVNTLAARHGVRGVPGESLCALLLCHIERQTEDALVAVTFRKLLGDALQRGGSNISEHEVRPRRGECFRECQP